MYNGNKFQDQDEDRRRDRGDIPNLESNWGYDAHNPHKRYAGIISWMVSGAIHATVIMLAGTIYYLTMESEQEIPPVRMSSVPPPPEKMIDTPKMEREILDPKVALDIESKSDNPSPITTLDLPDAESISEEESDTPVSKGREEAVADTEMGNQGAFMAIGAGGGGAGMFGSRSGGGRKRAVGRGGGSKGSESAVEAALRWFKKHQSPNGMWDAEGYFQNCSEDNQCEPGSLAGYGPESVNTAMTGYALLCFLGAGYDHRTPNKYKSVIRKGLDYLLSVQSLDGLLGKLNYEHAVATMALAESYAMTNDPDLRRPSQRAVDVLVARQNKDKVGELGLGWGYNNPGDRNDASATGWCVMALKSAHAAGLSVGNAMTGARSFLERSWRDTNTNKEWCKNYSSLDPYRDISRYPYVWKTTTGDIEISSWNNGKPNVAAQDLASVGMALAVFLGHKSGDLMLETLANYVMKYQITTAYPTNTYYMYYATLGMFQIGGEKWKAWNSTVRDMLVNAQRNGVGCFDGSWDWQGTVFHGHSVGRVLSTAYNTLCLEVYYRYEQVNAKR